MQWNLKNSQPQNEREASHPQSACFLTMAVRGTPLSVQWFQRLIGRCAAVICVRGALFK